jgi:hypothetical protein
MNQRHKIVLALSGGVFLLLTTVFLWAYLTKRIQPRAAEGDQIINTATITYESGTPPQTYSTSASVTVNIIASDLTINLTLPDFGVIDAAKKADYPFKLYYRPAGNGITTLLKTFTATLGQTSSITVAGIASGTAYDFYLKPDKALSKKIANITRSGDAMSLNFSTKTYELGDIDTNQNDYIGSDDLARIIADWPSRNNNELRPNSDIDKNGVVDGVDADKIIANWDKKGDKYLDENPD